MLKLVFDSTLCRGNAACVVAAPGLFDYDEDRGQTVPLRDELVETDLDSVHMAIMHCPTRAITLEG